LSGIQCTLQPETLAFFECCPQDVSSSNLNFNVGQVDHVSPTPWLRKKLTSRVALLRRLAGSGCGAGATTLQTAALVLVHSTTEYCAPVRPQCSYLPYRHHHHRRLANCDWMPASDTSGQHSHTRRHPACWASSLWSHTVSSTPCHGTWTFAPLRTHRSIKCRNTAPQIKTAICTRRTTSHQFIQGWIKVVWGPWLKLRKGPFLYIGNCRS